VDVNAFEEIALLEIENGLELGMTLIVDEIGKMELLSDRFRDLVPRILDADRVLVTAPVHADPIIEPAKARDDVDVIELPMSTRADLAVRIADRVVESAVTSR
jgi:nucleoside-triphosphatase